MVVTQVRMPELQRAQFGLFGFFGLLAATPLLEERAPSPTRRDDACIVPRSYVNHIEVICESHRDSIICLVPNSCVCDWWW